MEDFDLRKYLAEGKLLKEGDDIKDRIKYVTKIILTNLISQNPDEIGELHDEFVEVTDREEFDDIGHKGRVIVNKMLDWSKYHYNKDIYRGVDELMNNFDWEGRGFGTFKDLNLDEGVINEEVNLGIEISTPKELLDFIGGEGIDILDDITNIGENPVLNGDKIWKNSIELKHGPEEEGIEEYWFDGYTRTKKKIISKLLDNMLVRNKIEEFIGRDDVIEIIEKSKKKYGIGLSNLNNYIS